MSWSCGKIREVYHTKVLFSFSFRSVSCKSMTHTPASFGHFTSCPHTPLSTTELVLFPSTSDFLGTPFFSFRKVSIEEVVQKEFQVQQCQIQGRERRTKETPKHTLPTSQDRHHACPLCIRCVTVSPTPHHSCKTIGQVRIPPQPSTDSTRLNVCALRTNPSVTNKKSRMIDVHDSVAAPLQRPCPKVIQHHPPTHSPRP
jgi:hypothetical protein